MNKKQKNRKLIAQNKRNRMVNRRYTSTIKTLSKLFKLKIKESKGVSGTSVSIVEKETNLKKDTLKIMSKIYSIVDKAVKKNVIHKNTASRKKSNIGKLYNRL
jgi:small subunit ribosomal protein S20